MRRHQPNPDRRTGRVLFLAQLPPPWHGQSVMAAAVDHVLAEDAGLDVRRRWRGGARTSADVGRRSVAKALGFLRLLAELIGDLAAGRRYEIAYLGMVPWAHTRLRDALIAGLAKLLARRVWVHVHGSGLAEILCGGGLANRIARRLIAGTELLAPTAATAGVARTRGRFSGVAEIANVAADPGAISRGKSDRLTITCFANLDPRKGVTDFIDIVAELARGGYPVRGLIAGGETAALSLEEVRRRIRAAGAEDTIEATGWVCGTRKTEILAVSDVLLHLSRHDLAPVSVIEALAHGVVPIVLDTGGLREMVGTELARNVLDPQPEATLAARVEAIIATYVASRECLEADRAAARRRYLEAYHPDRFRDAIIRLVGEAAPSHSGRPVDRAPIRTEGAL